MSDEERMDVDGDDGDLGHSIGDMPKSKKSGGFITTIIKWIAMVLGAIIFIVTVVVITESVIKRSGKSSTPIPVSEEWRDNREILEWYQAIGVLKVYTADSIRGMLIVNMALGYTKNNKSTPQELSARKIEIIDFLQTYFNGKTIAELEQRERIRLELRNEINDNILTKNKIKDVRFTQYDIVPQ